MEECKEMVSFNECVGKKVTGMKESIDARLEAIGRKHPQWVEPVEKKELPAVVEKESSPEECQESQLEIVQSKVFGKQGIVYVERNGNPEDIKWYWEKGKIKFNSTLSEEEILRVVKELWK